MTSSYFSCLYTLFQEGRGPGRVFATLHGHSGRVNCVRWIPSLSPPLPPELVSGGADGKVIVWRREKDGQVSGLRNKREKQREFFLVFSRARAFLAYWVCELCCWSLSVA